MVRTKNFADLIRAELAQDPSLAELVEDAAINARIAREIYDRRVECGLTQSELAEKAGTKQSVIARLEDASYSGHSLTTLKKISRAMGCELHVELFKTPSFPLVSSCESVSYVEWSREGVAFGSSVTEPVAQHIKVEK